MIPYSQDYLPPAPVIEVGLGNIRSRRRRQMASALLDTGSDITAIPKSFVDSLRLYPVSRLELEDVALECTVVLSYAVQLAVGGLVIPRLEVILTALEVVILGRDVLNHFYLTLRGPELSFDLSMNPSDT